MVLCPLRFEAARIRRGLRSCGIDAPRDVTIDCCGLGARGVERWARDGGAAVPAGATVILVGVAGSLCESIVVRQARVIAQVRSENREEWTPPLQPAEGSNAPAILASASMIVASAEDRVAFAQRTGAQLVDMEAAAFARIATQRGWRWGVVRGVSDDLHTLAPSGMDGWITSDGQLRGFAVLAALARNPRMLPALRCLHHNSNCALDAAAALVHEVLQFRRKKV